MTTSLTLFSPAKINLHLRVAPPDATGFHPLRSWMVTVGLHDALRGTVANSASGISLHIEGDASLAADATNLVHRAAVALRPMRGLTFELMKRIPSGAGLGGGSGNAATALVLVNTLLEQNRSREELHEVAATLGSDVPFFLHAPSAIATGRGERLESCPPPRPQSALLILPPFGVSTPAAYRTLDQLRPTTDTDVLAAFDVDVWSSLAALDLLPRLRNDLERAAFGLEPRLGALRIDVQRTVDRTVRMSGSGSTLFTLYDDIEAAEAAAAVVLSRFSGLRALAVPLGRDVIQPPTTTG